MADPSPDARPAVGPTGERFELRRGSVRAEIGSVAAVLLSLHVDGVPVTEPTPHDRMPPQGSGIVLAPWPNRVRGGRWEWRGQEMQLDLTDPSIGGATHGLLRNTAYARVDGAEDAVELAALVAPQHGWPFPLATRVRFQLEDDGIRVTHSVRNLGAEPAPWAVGAHPYLRVGDHAIEQLTLTVPAAARMVLDDTLIPIRIDEVEGTDADLSDGRRVEHLDLNHPYGHLDRGPSGELAWLDAPDGARTTLWGDEPFRWLQLYTPRDHPRPDGTGLAVAVEPMTAPPDALNSRTDLLELAPGATWSASWGIRYAPAEGS